VGCVDAGGDAGQLKDGEDALKGDAVEDFVVDDENLLLAEVDLL